MNKFTYVVLIFAFLLMFPPIILVIVDWCWVPPQDSKSIKWLFWLTETAGLPYNIITSVILLSITQYVFQPKSKQLVKFLMIIMCCVLAGQGLKSLVKNSVKEPRPYVVWLEKEYGISRSDFYDFKRKQRVDMIKTTIKHNNQIPSWQRKHWQAETGYSFPSGHVLFSSGWALLLIGLLWQRRQYALSIVMMIWAEGIVVSRMLLGMHWPSDIIASVIISAILALIANTLLKEKIYFESKE